MLKRTPLHSLHVSLGAKMVDFAGWEMPLYYRSILDEHQQTRTSGSLFDVSHMGRIQLSGPDAQRFLSRVLTRRVSDQPVGVSRYSLVCNEQGGVIDDVIVSRDAKAWTLVCNASNRETVLGHFNRVRRAESFDLDVSDQTEATVMLAVQGPKVISRMSEAMGADLSAMKRYTFQNLSVMLVKLTVFRSGYTGEDGVEVILPARMASLAMKMVGGKLDKPDATIKPAGLGARDTLRLEAAMPLYGHELSEGVDPVSAGLSWAVDFEGSFIGADAIRAVRDRGPAARLVGLVLDGKRIARQGTPLLAGGRPVGQVTSGTLSPTLQKSIAMAYVESAHAAEGATLVAQVKGGELPAHVARLPFYKRPAQA